MDDQKPRVIAGLHEGSRVCPWAPNGFAEGILEAPLAGPPRIHYFDSRGTVELVQATVAVPQPPRHEHMPLIPGQEYPRDIAPIADRLVTETRWMLPQSQPKHSKE